MQSQQAGPGRKSPTCATGMAIKSIFAHYCRSCPLIMSGFSMRCSLLVLWYSSACGLLAGSWIWAAPAFMLPLLLGSDLLIIPLSTNQTLSLIWIFFSVGVVASAIERLGSGGRTLVVVFAMGAIANYFDLLINPPLAPALIAFLVM